LKLLKWLFHPLHLLLAIIAIAIFVNRDVLFEDEAGEAAAPVVAEAAPVSHTPAVAATHDDSSTVQAVPAAAAAEPVPAALPYPIAAPVLAPSSSEASSEGAAGEVAAASTDAETTTEPKQSALALWYKARQLAWEGKSEQAVEVYQQLIELRPDNFDVHGELGNVYLQLHRVEAACDAYQRAAVLLHEAGNGMMAWHLQRVIQGLDLERGERLRRVLMGQN